MLRDPGTRLALSAAAFLAGALLVGAAPPAFAQATAYDVLGQSEIDENPGDPQSLNEMVAKVKDMQAQGKNRGEIAQFISGVVDRRLSSTNRVSAAGGDSYGVFLPGPTEAFGGTPSEWSKRFETFTSQRESFGLPGGAFARSEPSERANWAWNNGVGNCREAQAISYTILSRAGIPAHMVQSNAGNGHDFVVIGATPAANMGDPTTWGADAWVVDGWTGDALTAEQALKSPHHANGGKAEMSDRTGTLAHPERDKRWAELEGKGILVLQVIDKATRRGIDRLGVRIEAGDASVSGATSNGGRFTTNLPVGPAKVTVLGTSQYAGASVSVEMAERETREVSVALEQMAEEAPPVAPAASGSLIGQGRAEYPVWITGAARFEHKEGALTVQMVIDLDRGTVGGQIGGSLSAVVVSGKDRQNVSSTMNGSFRGSYHGSPDVGTFDGVADVLETAMGQRVPVRGRFSGTLRGPWVECTFFLDVNRIVFRFPVRPR